MLKKYVKEKKKIEIVFYILIKEVISHIYIPQTITVYNKLMGPKDNNVNRLGQGHNTHHPNGKAFITNS